MKLIIAAVLAASCAAVAMPAAAGEWIGSVEYQQLQFQGSGPHPGVVAGQLDYRSGHIWGVEAEASTGVIKDQNTNVGDQVAFFATASFPVSSSFDVFARGGYGFISYNAAGARGNANYWGYGVGADLWLNKSWGLRADYTRESFNKTVPDANVYGAGITHKF